MHGTVLARAEHALRVADPSVHGRRVAVDQCVELGQLDGDERCRRSVVSLAVEGVGTLAKRQGLGIVALPVAGLAQTVERLGDLGEVLRLFEEPSSGRPVTRNQCGATPVQEGIDVHGHGSHHATDSRTMRVRTRGFPHASSAERWHRVREPTQECPLTAGTTTETTAATPAGGWQLQGNAAEAYQSYLVPAIFRAMSRRLVTAADVGLGDRVLDVATGTGVVARTAAERVGPRGTVVAIDVNPDMLATAARASTDVTPQIDWRQADATELPFGDATFDVVMCQEAIQFLDDRVAALREMRRTASPDGRIIFSVFRSLAHHPVYELLARSLGEHAGLDAATMMGSPFALGDASVLRAAAHDAGLRGVQIQIAINEERFPSVAEFVRREAASSPLAGPLSALDEHALAALVAQLELELASHLDDAGMAFHNETHIVTATP